MNSTLQKNDFRCKLDDRKDKKAGWKFAHWEQKGVPLRIEVGPRNVERGECDIVCRHSGEKRSIKFDSLSSSIVSLLVGMQLNMLNVARKQRDENLSIAWDMKSFLLALEHGKLILTPWSCTTESEEAVKATTKAMGQASQCNEQEEINNEGESRSLTGAAKTLCIPFNQPILPVNTMCFTGCGKVATCWCLWGRSY